MRKLLILALPLLFAACGVNRVPEKSDIQENLENLTGHCDFLKFSDVKKLNGMENGPGQYLVQQEYTLTLTPLPEFVNDAKTYLTYRQETEKVMKKYAAMLAALGPELEAYRKARNEAMYNLHKEYSQRKAMLENRRYGPGMPSAQYVKDELQKLEDWFNENENAIKQADLTQVKEQEVFQARNAEYDQLAAKLPPLTENDFIRKVKEGYDKHCPGIRGKGASLVYRLLGDSTTQELKVFAEGAKSTFTENNVAYVKTEQGWIRSN